jgi:acyl-CoA reductase-like NAD-dependent aldehyde dehydrogenase
LVARRRGVAAEATERAPSVAGTRTTTIENAKIDVYNPATGAYVASVPCVDGEALTAFAQQGREVQPAWAELGFAGRAALLGRARHWLADNSARVIETLISETGKAYEDAQNLELAYALGALSFWARKAPEYLADQRATSYSPLVPGRRLLTRYIPRGLVGVIGPWNYPLINSFGDCIPALAAGNSVILKPSELTPLTSLLLADGLAQSGVPDGVFQVAPGGGETAAALVDLVDFVMFTGSIATGRKVALRAAERLTPVSLELGGKDAMVVLAGSDLERAANAAVFYAMINGGQTCVSIERVYAESAIYDEFVSKLALKVAAVRCGEPGGPGTVDVGAITDPRQLATIDAHVADAAAKGARVLVGGKQLDGPGRFYEPTLIVDADHTMACMTDETFGPTLAVMRAADADDAVRLVNDSRYGLGAAVFARDGEEGERLARRLQVGAVCVNDAAINYFAFQAPMGGAKDSGLGVRHGADGIRKFCDQQTVLTTPRWMFRREPQMYPYSARMTRLLGRALKLVYGRGR